MILFLKAEQQSLLFDAPVLVQGSVRKDGSVVKPHVRIQKKKLPDSGGTQGNLFGDNSTEQSKKPSKLDAFIAKQGGMQSLASKLSMLTEGQQQTIFEKIAALDGKTIKEVSAMFDGLKVEEVKQPDLFAQPAASGNPSKTEGYVTPPKLDLPIVEHDGDTWYITNTGAAREDGKVYAHLSSATRGRHARNGIYPVQISDWIRLDKPEVSESASDDLPIVEHVTRKGKIIRGIIRKDLTKEEAAGIDQYTFLKDGGWFIREKHLEGEAYQNSIKKKTPLDTNDSNDSETVSQEKIDNAIDPLVFGVKAGITKAERRKLNTAAAALVMKVPGDMTDADRALLRQYSGNGGCGDSLNEFYTDPAVALAMWKVAERLGITHGTALEPSCGSGVFLHTAPDGIKVTGVELESISAKIAEALHGERHEIVNASLERFATQDTRRFDIVIGNPPYGPRGMLLKDDKKDLSKAEEYFIDTSLDKTRADGLCMLVVPSGIMDSKNGRKFRERMLRKAEFLGAQRLPNSAFEASHTDVTADVIYLRKRPDDVAGALGTLDKKTLQSIGVWDDEFLSGAYFEGRGKSNVFGEVGTAMRAFGEIYTVNGSMRDVPDLIEKFDPNSETKTPSMQDILNALPDESDKNRALNAADKKPYHDGAKVGDIKIEDGVTYVLQGNPPRWHRADEAMQSEAVTSALELAAEIDRLMSGQAVDRAKLEEDVREWMGLHGIPSNHPDLLVAAANDKTLYRLIGAVGKDGRLSDVVSGREAERIEGGFDAVAQSLALSHESGDFTVAELAEALNKDEDEVLDQLFADARYAVVNDERWSPMDAYLTGQLWPKLDTVNAKLSVGGMDGVMRSKLENQKRQLEETIDPKSLEDVDIQLNSAFIPLNVMEVWIDSRADELREKFPESSWYRDMAPASVTFEGGVYKIGKGVAINDGLLDKYLNRTGVRKDDLPTIEEWNEQFKEWLLTSEHREMVEDLYNRKFRGFVHREYSDEPIDIPGLANHDKIKPYQWPGLRWALAAGKGIIADDVGLGKTIRALMLARLAKLTGKAQKPIIVAPKSVLANWYVESQKWFPGSKVMTIGGDFSYDANGKLVGRDDNKNERERKYHDITQNDYDFIVISEPVFQEIDLDPKTKKEMYDTDFWVQRGDSLGNAGDKRIKKIREAYEQSIAKREFSGTTGVIYFNDLGVDMVIADEAHHNKNLYAAKSRFGDSPKFLGGQGLSNRALDFNLKARWLLNNNGGKGVYGLTATPTKNSPLEIYSMLSHIAPEAFERIGIRNSEEFLDRFCKFETDNVLSTSGEIEEALVVAGFKNMDELRNLMAQYIRRTTADDVGLKLPGRDDRMHLIDMTPQQQAVYDELREMAVNAAKKDATGDAHIFSVMDKMNKAALDLEIYDPETYVGVTSPKYKELAKHVASGIKEGGQVVFSDYIDAHDKIVRELVKSGIPKNKIGVINAQVASSSVKRQNIADQFNSGKLKVVIGNTATMGEGINLQMGTTDIHHMDLPWEPASVQQRNGRGLRQGNISEAVRIHTYLSKGSFDGYRYQSIGAKKDWQDLLWNGGDKIENLSREGNISRDEMLIMLSADPDAAREKFASDKEAALQRHEAGERAKAAEEYVRFQTLTAGYKALKNKNTTSAAMLQSKMEKARVALKGNRFFTAKNLLDSDTDALMEPQSGNVFHAGFAFHAVNEGGEKEGQFVVTGVNLKDRTVSVRGYADIDGRKRTVKLADLKHGITPFAFSEEDEAKAVSIKIEERAAAGLSDIKDYKQLVGIPSNVLTASGAAIQAQLKEGAKNYKLSIPNGKLPMINKESGAFDLVDHYSVRDKLDTHDFVLPTDENKKRLEDAWMDQERNIKFGTEAFTSSRKRGSNSSGVTHAIKEYRGASFGDKKVNPFSSHVASTNGESFSYYDERTSKSVKALKDRFHKEQVERAKKAKTLNQTIDEVAPLGVVQDYTKGHGAHVKLPKKALAILWAKARHLGVLGDKLVDHLPQVEVLGGRSLGKHNGYFHGSRHEKSVHAALIGMAKDAGYDDLVSAMVESGLRHYKEADHKEVLSQLHQDYGHSDQVLKMMLKLAEASGIADMKAVNAETGIQNAGILRPRQWGGDEHKTIREIIEGRIKNG